MPTAAKKVFIWLVSGKGPVGGAGKEAMGTDAGSSELASEAFPEAAPDAGVDAAPTTGAIGPELDADVAA